MNAQQGIVSSGTCVFGVEAHDQWAGALGGAAAKIGAFDVIDLINDSVNKFKTSDGLVGAKGTVPCAQSFITLGGTTHDIIWGIYHS